MASGFKAIWSCVAIAAIASGQSHRAAMTRQSAFERAGEMAALGRKLFFDPALSGSGKLSCASCHDPAFAYGPPNARSVQQGGGDMRRWGTRATPSLKYLQIVPQFTEHYFDADTTGDDGVDAGPTGGFTWDGRVDRGRDQARIPLLSPDEMANPNPAAVVEKAKSSLYAGELKRLSGRGDTASLFATILEALETWQQDYVEFYPYTSKYDAWLAGTAKLTESERRGLEAFVDPARGNCARCHPATRGVNGTPPQFTDYSLVALGVPRNREIPANSDPKWFDRGLCGPLRDDLRSKSEYCGRFMTPTLRNVALRKVFFHNGVLKSLKDAVEFYAKRDTNPERWYPRSDSGAVMKFDDLPPAYQRNVETELPFGQAPGTKPALSDGDVADIVAFLETLTDGFSKVNIH